MKGLLVRAGVDQAYGRWNAPIDPRTNQFVYVPIPEKRGTKFHPGMGKQFGSILPALKRFCSNRRIGLFDVLRFPVDLLEGHMHLDPDFDNLTYGDQGTRRGSNIWNMDKGDIIAFYGGFRPVRKCSQKLVYAIFGLYVVESVFSIQDVTKERWSENAHTRKMKHGPLDVIVRAIPGLSGRLQRCIPIGQWRDGAYRVRKDILRAWGGLSVKNGYIQRSAVPPFFSDANRFYDWFLHQGITLSAANNPYYEEDKVVIIHLRRPIRNDPKEMRSDPFWGLGSFGCTGCHSRNLLNPNKADQLHGVRLAFAQGGDKGFRLVYLTPPIKIVRHAKCCEASWKPVCMPFRYQRAPLLIDNKGNSDLSSLCDYLKNIDRSTWMAKFSSAFRSRRRPIIEPLASQIISVYQKRLDTADKSALATTYVDALPYPPSKIDTNRRKTLLSLRSTYNKKPCRSVGSSRH